MAFLALYALMHEFPKVKRESQKPHLVFEISYSIVLISPPSLGILFSRCLLIDPSSWRSWDFLLRDLVSIFFKTLRIAEVYLCWIERPDLADLRTYPQILASVDGGRALPALVYLSLKSTFLIALLRFSSVDLAMSSTSYTVVERSNLRIFMS